MYFCRVYVHSSTSAVEHICVMWQSYLFSDICHMCVQCPLSHAWLHWLHMWHRYMYTSSIYIYQTFGIKGNWHMAYMPNLVGIYVSSKYLAITWEVYIAFGCFLAHGCKMLGLYTHLICWLCDLYMQCGSHFVKYYMPI